MKLYVFGDTHYAQLAAELSETDPHLQFTAFVVHRKYLKEESLLGYPVMAFEDIASGEGRETIAVFSAIGYRAMRIRQQIFEMIKELGFRQPNIIGAGSTVANSAQLGENNIVMPGSVVEAGVKLGDNNVVWSSTTICHHSNVGNHNFFAANSTIGGEVAIGSLNFFGFGSIVEQARTVGDENLLGAASYLNCNVGSAGKWLGVPAKKVGTHADLGINIVDPTRM